MACSCKGGSSSGVTSPSSFQVRKPDGTTVSYRSKVEAQAAAQRTGGRCLNC